MNDIRRTLLKAGRDLAGAAQIHLVETSPALRAKQEALLGPELHWHAGFSTIPRGPLLLVANEFFDALPVRQLIRAENSWAERCVGLDAEDRFVFVAGQQVPPPPSPPHRGEGGSAWRCHSEELPSPLGGGDGGGGALFEISPAREALMTQIARRIVREGGIALIIDYGHLASAPGDTLQAVKSHAYADPLAEPGEADLTAHVDFAALARAAQAEGARVHGPVTQGAFLNALGLPLRVEALKKNAAGIEDAARRLTAPDQMGTLFKVMAVTPTDSGVLAGFP